MGLSKGLLELEFKSKHSIKSKCLKWIVKKNTARLQRMENTQSEIKPIKLWKIFGTTYCLGCKDYTDNFKPQKAKMTNKVPRKKTNYVVCQSSESRFLKQ